MSNESLCLGGCDFDAEGCWHSQDNGSGPCCDECNHPGDEGEFWRWGNEFQRYTIVDDPAGQGDTDA